MAISLYDFSIPALTRGLTNMSAILDKAAAYAAAIANSLTPGILKKSERAWILRRNNSAVDVDALTKTYQDRISYLNSIAGGQTAAPQ